MNDFAETRRPSPANVALENHPCFNRKACRDFGRIHLPVAPKCNIQCNYCSRKYDCVNESRPGVTSTVLSPSQALRYLEGVVEMRDDIAVVGIAGPGDPFANADETLETFRLVRQRFPSMILCLSTNGLGLTEAYVQELAALEVSHVTLTINAVDAEVSQHIYAWARQGRKIYRKREAAELMLEHHMKAVGWVKNSGMLLKVNGIILPGVNEDHLAEVAETVGGLGADLMNCIPLAPAPGTPFANLGEPDRSARLRVHQACRPFVSQMTHCARCRADAVGKLNEPMPGALVELIKACARGPLRGEVERPYVAVATREGLLVNQHLGEAEHVVIFDKREKEPQTEDDALGGFFKKDVRALPATGGGHERWEELANLLHDCRAVLVAAAGERPKRVLSNAGVRVIEMDGMIEDGLSHVFEGTPKPKGQGFIACGHACSGDGMGCG